MNSRKNIVSFESGSELPRAGQWVEAECGSHYLVAKMQQPTPAP